MLVVISYDVTDKDRLIRVAKEMENFGTRVQKSVFECYLDDDQFARVRRLVSALIDKETDHVRYYRVCRKDEKKVLLVGNAVKSKDYDYFLV